MAELDKEIKNSNKEGATLKEIKDKNLKTMYKIVEIGEQESEEEAEANTRVVMIMILDQEELQENKLEFAMTKMMVNFR